jgi:hypothetical protein
MIQNSTLTAKYDEAIQELERTPPSSRVNDD